MLHCMPTQFNGATVYEHHTATEHSTHPQAYETAGANPQQSTFYVPWQEPCGKKAPMAASEPSIYYRALNWQGL